MSDLHGQEREAQDERMHAVCGNHREERIWLDGHAFALAAREEPSRDNEDASSDPVDCANPRCLGGANCPGHPWREDELEQLNLLEMGSRDMNVAAYRGAGFRQAANFYRLQIGHKDTERPDGPKEFARETWMASIGSDQHFEDWWAQRQQDLESKP